ncbi:MAG TPA: hypothetical protein VFQ61_35915 [Polyangiaceae bacterium]|nr:hypothetical protein [Polyangiaceae bacterium]
MGRRVQGALVEREVSGDRVPSLALDLHWALAPADGLPCALRIGSGARGADLVPTRAEARKIEAEARKAEAEARAVAEARVRELEAELRRRSSPKSGSGWTLPLSSGTLAELRSVTIGVDTG